jgi:hypothetical protein
VWRRWQRATLPRLRSPVRPRSLTLGSRTLALLPSPCPSRPIGRASAFRPRVVGVRVPGGIRAANQMPLLRGQETLLQALQRQRDHLGKQEVNHRPVTEWPGSGLQPRACRFESCQGVSGVLAEWQGSGLLTRTRFIPCEGSIPSRSAMEGSPSLAYGTWLETRSGQPHAGSNPAPSAGCAGHVPPLRSECYLRC